MPWRHLPAPWRNCGRLRARDAGWFGRVLAVMCRVGAERCG